MPKKTQCSCGQRILLPDNVLRGKCPRCGRIISLREPALPPARAASHTPPTPPVPSGAKPSIPTWLTSAILGLFVLVLGGLSLHLLSNQRSLERRLDSLTPSHLETDPRATETGGTGATATLENLRDQVSQLDRRLDGLGRDLDGTEPSASAGTARPASHSPALDLEQRVVALAEKVTPSIVSIQNGRGTGSGIIISRDGFILTNDHVVQGATDVRVQLSDGVVHPGRVLGKDSYSDVACIKIDGKNLPALPFGDSEVLRVGQVVAALGNPFGISRDGSPTVTLGIISALHRVLPIGENRQYRDAIQTDAAINPGNSGGALVDLDGRLIGINGAITSTTGSNSGIGFAIPINFVERILPSLRTGRSTEPGFMGITVGEMSTAQIEARGFRGAVVTGVSRNGPAAQAGLQTNDIIRSFQGKDVATSTRLLNLISYYQVGDTVRMEIWRSGRIVSLRLRIGKRPGG